MSKLALLLASLAAIALVGASCSVSSSAGNSPSASSTSALQSLGSQVSVLPPPAPALGAPLSSASGSSLTQQGWAVCLPGYAPACVIGLQTKDGKYYQLLDQTGKPLSPSSFTTGSQITVTGIAYQLRNVPDQSIVGAIEVSP